MSTILIGPIPGYIREKAKQLISDSSPHQGAGWKKLKRLKGCYSFRLSQEYRLLWLHGRQTVVCNHDNYVRKINSFRNRRCRHASSV
nr:hypothetical protein [Pseudodesulfovibrio sp.]